MKLEVGWQFFRAYLIALAAMYAGTTLVNGFPLTKDDTLWSMYQSVFFGILLYVLVSYAKHKLENYVLQILYTIEAVSFALITYFAYYLATMISLAPPVSL